MSTAASDKRDIEREIENDVRLICASTTYDPALEDLEDLYKKCIRTRTLPVRASLSTRIWNDLISYIQLEFNNHNNHMGGYFPVRRPEHETTLFIVYNSSLSDYGNVSSFDSCMELFELWIVVCNYRRDYLDKFNTIRVYDRKPTLRSWTIPYEKYERKPH